MRTASAETSRTMRRTSRRSAGGLLLLLLAACVSAPAYAQETRRIKDKPNDEREQDKEPLPARVVMPPPPSPDPPAPPSRIEGSLLGLEPPPVGTVPIPNTAAEWVEVGEVLVATSDMETAETLRRTLAERGIEVRGRRTMKQLGLTLTRFLLPPEADLAGEIDSLRNEFPDLAIDANHRYRLKRGESARLAREWIAAGPADPECGRNVRIGMVDSLADADHPALRGQSLVQESFLAAGEKPATTEHGTALAALLIGRADAGDFAGIVPAAHLYLAAGFRARDEDDTTAARVIEALDWLMAKDVQVINLSFAGPPNGTLELALERVLDDGRLLVAAAGNAGPRAPPAYPAAYPGVLAVTAVDARGRIYRKANRGDYIDLAAPGVDIRLAAPGGGGARRSGTSFAAPFVTGLLARILADGRQAVDAREMLLTSARDLGAPGSDPLYGRGLIQAQTCP